MSDSSKFEIEYDDDYSSDESIGTLYESESEPEMDSEFIESIPEQYRDTYIHYIRQLKKMSPDATEFFKLNQWKTTFEKIPFGKFAQFPFTDYSHEQKVEYLSNIKKIMDTRIYGQARAKSSAIELIVKWMINPHATGQVLAFHGEPGVGKTEFCKTVLSPVLSRPVHYVSLAGASTGSFIDGFHYTFEGSRPGRVVDGLVKTGIMNPIFFFDELDKISGTEIGFEIVNKLINLTDPNQNGQFTDQYFPSVPFDLSKAIIVFSFNDISKIDKILLDRIQIVKMDPFTALDKIKLFHSHLLIPALTENGFSQDGIFFSDTSIKFLISYCGDNIGGIRQLKRLLNTILMRINVSRFENKLKFDFSKKISITVPLLKELLK